MQALLLTSVFSSCRAIAKISVQQNTSFLRFCLNGRKTWIRSAKRAASGCYDASFLPGKENRWITAAPSRCTVRA